MFSTSWNFLARKYLTSARTQCSEIKLSNWRRHSQQNSAAFLNFATGLFRKLFRILKTLSSLWFGNAWRLCRPFSHGSLSDIFSKQSWLRRCCAIWSPHLAPGLKLLSYSLKYHKSAWRMKRRQTRICTEKRHACIIACSLSRFRMSPKVET